ncbi:MAG TPA: class I adenylate-forming enzyme family protein [Opitutaceae bacterium]
MSTTSELLLQHHWDALVRSAPDAPALIDAAKQRVLSRAEIDSLAQTWAARANVSGVSLRGARVGFALPNGADWLTVFIGIIRLGGVALPIDASEPPAQQRTLASGARANFWWTGEALEPVAASEQKMSRPRKPIAEANNPFCLIKLTSGSTGRPRPLVFRDSEMIADGRAICATMGITPKDINLGIIPFGHSYGLGNLLMPLLVQGTAVLCVSAPLPHAIAENCARWKPTVFPAVPALLRLLTLSDVSPSSFASLRTVISAGSLLSPEIAQGFFEKFGRHVHGFYGSSETGGITYDRTGEATLQGRSVGTPLEGVHLHFQRGKRFLVESASVFTVGNRRVRRQKADTTASMLGRHRTADRGEINALGELTLLGRAGRMMKIAGRRIDLSELEATVRKLTGVRDAFFMAHPQRPEELAGIVAGDLDLESMRALLRRELAPWKVPKKLIVLAQFPLTGRGKTDTSALRRILE